ncbi:MAG: S-layer glycoprotein N-glycosyltransferase AglJ [Methermicoccaceae archaeon]
MGISKDEVCILVPTLNEESTIEGVVREFKAQGFSHVLVVDGHSTDNTVELATRAGADVLEQMGKGKGDALLYALERIPQQYIVLVDGDGTYDPHDVDKLLEPLEHGYDHVIGERFTLAEKKAFTRLNRVGNAFLNRLFSVIYGQELVDILSGYRAFTRDSLSKLTLGERGFGIESEMAVECVKRGQRVAVIPVRYYPRPASSITKLNPFRDGSRITSTMYRLAIAHNPMFYFGLMGVILLLVGFGLGAYVVYDWLRGIEHVPLTILTIMVVLAGVQVLIFGMLGNLVVVLHRELLIEIKRQGKR